MVSPRVVETPIPRAIETQLIPLYELAAGDMALIRNQAIKAVVALASKELKKDPSQLLVRDIEPATDLDYTTEDWYEVTGLTANAYETMSTGNLANDRYVGIYGVMVSGGPPVTLIRFTVGGGWRAIWNLQNLSVVQGEDMIGISPSVVIIPPNQPYTISRYVRLTSTPCQLVLKGFVVEPRGRVLSP